MSNHPSRIVHTAFGIFAFFVALSLTYTGITLKPHIATASLFNPLAGYAWSDNVGWLSMSGTGYQVGINTDNTLSGYAWGDNVGWVSFNASDVASCGSGPTYNPLDQSLSGWARALNGVNSDGCISLSGSGYGVKLDGTHSYAWASDTIGWLDFAQVSSSLQPCPNGQGWAGQCMACNSGYVLSGGNCALPSGSVTGQLIANPTRVRNGDSTTLTWSTTGMTGCTVTDGLGTLISSQTSSAGTPVSNIGSAKTFTLTCTDGARSYYSTARVLLVPQLREI